MWRFILGGIVSSCRNGRRRRENNRRLNNIDRENIQRRNVIEYNDSPIEAFLSNDPTENIVVSGSNNNVRERVLCASAWNCYQQRRAAVILHCGNYNLVNRLWDTFRNTNFLCLDSSNGIYDPFIGLERADVSQFILASSGHEYRIERSGGSYIYGLYDYLQQIGRPVCVETLYNCMRDRSHENILQESQNGNMSDFMARRINSELAQGQLEMGNIEQYLSALRHQGNGLIADESRLSQAISLRSVIRDNRVVAIDISDSSNTLLLDIIVQELRAAITDRNVFSLLIDDVPIEVTESFIQLIRMFSGNNTLVYSAQDAYSQMQSTTNVLDTLLGRAATVIVLQHYSSVSSSKFSEFFGNYQKLETTQQFGMGRNAPPLGVFQGSYDNEGSTVQLVVKPRVEEGDISGQPSDHAFIKKRGRTEIIDVYLTNGNANAHYDEPTRQPIRQQNVRSTINWGIFTLLLILCFPIAFIYSFVKCGRKGKIISVIILIFLLLIIIAEAIAASQMASVGILSNVLKMR